MSLTSQIAYTDQCYGGKSMPLPASDMKWGHFIERDSYSSDLITVLYSTTATVHSQFQKT